MNIHKNSVNNLDKIGIYKITNLINGKVYIGSTCKSFLSRFTTHYSKLKTNNHKSYWHLQNSVNKHGIDKFEFEILEECNCQISLDKEEYWIKFYDSINREKGYNLNPIPSKSPMNNKETRDKVSIIIKEKYRSGEMIPNSTVFKKGQKPWNAGKKYQSTNHLKVPKKKKSDRTKFIETVKEKQIPIDVFDLKNNYIISFKYIEDIIQESLKEKSILIDRMILKNKKGRNGYPPFKLNRSNILESCKSGKPHKGLIFKHNAEANLKSDKLLENP